MDKLIAMHNRTLVSVIADLIGMEVHVWVGHVRLIHIVPEEMLPMRLEILMPVVVTAAGPIAEVKQIQQQA